MDPDPWLLSAFGVWLVLLAKVALFSGLETAVLSARRSRLGLAGKPRTIAHVETVLEDPDQFLTSAHLAKSLCEAIIYPAAAVCGLNVALRFAPRPLPSDFHELILLAWPGLLLGPVVAYFSVTIFGEALPKAFAVRQPERILGRWIGFVRLFTSVFLPVYWITRRLARTITASLGGTALLSTRAAHSEEEIKLLVESSAEEGVLEEEEKEMIHSIFEFTDTVARQIMVPRIDIHSVDATCALGEVLDVVLASGHSRIPVHEDTLDHVVGIIHVKDLLPHLARGEREVPIGSLMREPFFVPEGKKIDELLQEFRTHKSQLAIVVDEFGGTSGLVTIEDVLEEIVGEIEDEYDVDEHPGAQILETGEGVLIDARMSIDDVNETLGYTLPTGDYDTLGGLVFSVFGRPPVAGERIELGEQELIVEAAEGLRILKVRIIPKSSASDLDVEGETPNRVGLNGG